jgi:hypothetical protein
VTGYFPILSSKSDPLKMPKLLNLHGIDIDTLVTTIGSRVFSKILRQCQMFFDRSNASILAAVSAANADGGAGRITFAEVPFTDDNSVFAPEVTNRRASACFESWGQYYANHHRQTIRISARRHKTRGHTDELPNHMDACFSRILVLSLREWRRTRWQELQPYGIDIEPRTWAYCHLFAGHRFCECNCGWCVGVRQATPGDQTVVAREIERGSSEIDTRRFHQTRDVPTAV